MAGFGKLQDYKEGPTPGTTTFVLKDGSEKVFGGEAAEEYKKKLDQAKAIGPQPTAKNYAAAFTGQPQSASDVPTPEPGFGAPTPPASIARPPAPAPPPMLARPPEVPAGAGTAKGWRPIGNGYYANEAGEIGKNFAATAASAGGPVEKTRTERGGFEADPEYLKQKAALTDERTAAIEDQRRAQSENFEAEQAMLQDERVRMADAQAEELRRVQAIDAGVKQAELRRDAAVKEAASGKVDPGRYLSGGKNWIAGLANAMGSIGGARIGVDFQMSALQSRIQQDISAQEKEIQVRGETADNALADLTRKLGSQERAKLALGQIQTQMTHNSIAQQASREKDLEKRAQLQQLALGLQEQQLDFAEKYRLDSMGEVTKNYQIAQARAASAGGIRALSPDQQLAVAAKRQNLAQGEVGIAKDKAELAAGPGGGKGASPVSNELTADIAALDGMFKAGKSIKTKLEGQSSSWGDPTSGPIDRLYTSSQELDEDTQRLAAGYQAARGKSDTDAKLAEKDAMGGGSIDERRRGAENSAEKATSTLATKLATLPPAQQVQLLKTVDPELAAAVAARLGGGKK